jgi:hypothetical protein
VATYHEIDGENQDRRPDPVVRKEVVDQDEKCVEELFMQLWVIPKIEARVPPKSFHGGQLFWIRRNLVREKKDRPEDCFPVGSFQQVGKVATTLSLMRDIWASGEKATYKEVLKSQREEDRCGK